MIGYVVDTVIVLAAFALQIHLPVRPTAIAAALVVVCIAIQLTVGHNDDHYFFVFLIMMLVVLALIVRGIRGQLRRRAAGRLTGHAV